SSRDAYETRAAASGAKTRNEIRPPLVSAFCTVSMTDNSTEVFCAAAQFVSASPDVGRLFHVRVVSPQVLSATTASALVAAPATAFGVRRRRAASTRPDTLVSGKRR